MEIFRLPGEGRYREALALVDEAEPEASADVAAKLAFWRACLLALADDDLAAIADNPRFGELQRLSRQRLEAARRTPGRPADLGGDGPQRADGGGAAPRQ